MRKYSLFYDGCIFRSDNYGTFKFVIDTSNYTELDTINHQVVFHHVEKATYDIIPSKYLEKIIDDGTGKKEIIDGEIKLQLTTRVNNYYDVIVRNTAPSELLYTQLISRKIKSDEFEYKEYDNGCSIIISDKFKDMNKLVEYINKNSTMIYIDSGIDDFYDILGLNLILNPFNASNTSINPTDTTIYDAQRHVFLNEANVISAYIDCLKSKYPELSISNFNTESDLETTTRETLNYGASSLLVRPQHSTNIIITAPYGRLISSIISLQFVYSCSDVVTYLERKNSYQFQTFVNSIIQFPVIVYDEEDNIVDRFTFSAHYDTGNLDYSVQKQGNNSGKSGYQFVFPVEISCYLLEKNTKDDIKSIENVIANIYVKKQ